MIEKIQIMNFKSVIALELELGKLNVFIGENGCGKTNILEAITFGGAATGNKLDNEFLSTRGIRIVEEDLMRSQFSKDLSSPMTSINYFDKINENIHIGIASNYNVVKNYQVDEEIDRMFVSTEKDFLELPVQEMRNKSIDNDKDLMSLLNKLNEHKSNIKNNREENIINFLNYAPENYFLRRFEEEGQIRPLGIRGEGLFKHLVDIYKKQPELLKEIGEHLRLIGWFEGFEIPTDLMFTERRINIKDKYLQELDFFDQRSANEGFLYLLFYFTLFLSPFTPKFFAIDNIDNSLNPKLCAELIRQLVKISKENEKQTILTTHNPAILDGLDLTDDSQRLFTIYRNSEGHTEAKRIKAPKTVTGVEPVRLSEAYIRGYLGGLPKNF